jgi:hypothetical protein
MYNVMIRTKQTKHEMYNAIVQRYKLNRMENGKMYLNGKQTLPRL